MKHALMLLLLAALCGLAVPARASETDQYMTWSVELTDSAPALNAYLNEELRKFIELRNERTVPIKTPEEISLSFYAYLFEGLHKSRVRHFMFTSPKVDRYPDNDQSPWKYQRTSIYRDMSFPFVLPMARSVRLGDVYLGIDKVGHFFGFGRRYYSQYLRLREQGETEDQAIESVIKRGYFQEASLVGGLVDGIFSYGDLEANFQGMQMLKQFASGTAPCFVKKEDGNWSFEGQIDILPFITPDLDESWNTSHFTGMRRKNVTKRLAEAYCGKDEGEVIKARFSRYAEFSPSLSEQVITRLRGEEEDPRDKQSLDALCGTHAREKQAATQGCCAPAPRQ